MKMMVYKSAETRRMRVSSSSCSGSSCTSSSVGCERLFVKRRCGGAGVGVRIVGHWTVGRSRGWKRDKAKLKTRAQLSSNSSTPEFGRKEKSTRNDSSRSCNNVSSSSSNSSRQHVMANGKGKVGVHLRRTDDCKSTREMLKVMTILCLT